ncbi:MAG TPA: hypothetical protein VMT16_06615 [Thermoanaerobaculia bacterium]|nr:hypothetical protein [Thermoanaerobaculia bacterium]
MSRTTAASGAVRDQLPEPRSLWIRYRPRRWPTRDDAFVDLAAGTLGAPDPGAEISAELADAALDDLLYLPPVPAAAAATRDGLVRSHAARGTPVLVQRLPGDPPAIPEAWPVLDLLPVAMGRLEPDEAFAGVAGGGAVWPLLPGQEAGSWERVTAAAREAGVTALQPLPLELDARQRRSLAELSPDPSRFDALFHGRAPEPREVARVIVAHGLEPLLPRPLPRPPLRSGPNLRLASLLAVAGELSVWLGEPDSRSQSLLRAARWAERVPQSLEALAREGNLGVLPWLEGEPRRLVEEALAAPRPPLVQDLLARL